jgi:two-component system, OmpR family, response regulator
MRLLIIEDEERLADLLVDVFHDAEWETVVCRTGRSGLERVRMGDIDVVVLDWMLPGMDGPSVLRSLRADGHRVPVLLLTARAEICDRVRALDLGADDYLTKPFHVDELLARIRALHRRVHPGQAIAHRVGDLFMDPVERRVERKGVVIDLPGREFDILFLLVSRAGQVVDRYAILDTVWDGETDLRSNVIDVYIASIRAKIDRPFGKATVQTVRGRGYRVEASGA